MLAFVFVAVCVYREIAVLSAGIAGILKDLRMGLVAYW